MSEIETIVTEYVAEKAFASNADAIWMIITGVLVFFMHTGFAMLEAGSVQATTVTNILFKNIGTVSVGAVMYYLTGYGFAYGTVEGTSNSFLSWSMFGNYKNSGKAFWFFQMVFAATAATILSGAVAGRIRLGAYFLITVLLTGFVYPVITHWVWDSSGWLSAFNSPENLFIADDNNVPCGMVDYAGSGVVHLTGGITAFWGAFILGPRLTWTKAGIPPHNQALTTLGTFVLWFGWYGFNCGSSLVFDGLNAGHVAVTTTLSPAAACVTGFLVAKLIYKQWHLSTALNCVLGGLVSITAGCSTLRPGYAILTGIIAALVFIGGSRLIKKIGIDDPVDAITVHGFCGIWGVLAVGLFLDEGLLAQAYSGKVCDSEPGKQLVWQILGVISVIAWVSVFVIPLLVILKKTGKLRLSPEEEANVDSTEHGQTAYEKM